MPIVSIVYHSQNGHVAKLAEAIEDGAASVEEVEVRRVIITGDDIDKGRWSNPEIMARLNESTAIIFGAPTHMGDVSGQMKCFLDATSKYFFRRTWANKLAAGFTSAFYPSGDKLHSLYTFVTFAMQQGMIWIGHNEAPFDVLGDNTFQSGSLNRLGGWLGVMATAHPRESPDLFPAAPDLSAGRALGRRVGLAAVRWTNGTQDTREPMSEFLRKSLLEGRELPGL